MSISFCSKSDGPSIKAVKLSTNGMPMAVQYPFIQMWNLRTRVNLMSPNRGDGSGREMMHCLPESRRLSRKLLKTYLVAAGGVVEFSEGSVVAVRHVITTTEEDQCTGILWQGAPEHLNATLLLAERNGRKNVNNVNNREQKTIKHESQNYNQLFSDFILSTCKKLQDPCKRVSPLQYVFPGCPWGPGWCWWPFCSAGCCGPRCWWCAGHWTWKEEQP